MSGSILVSGLGKAYKKYHSKWRRLLELLMFGKIKQHELSWVLRGISFSVAPGEAVGIIGMNGAGKSTLLKLISGVSSLTEGKIEMKGRVVALLELGLGFHPDLTGKENVIIYGQLLGLSQRQIEQLLPSIEEFAEIGNFIDLPVRIYSSGMQVRLAFSVATAVRPDILIIDEALSVGDVYFQHKSFELIRSYRKLGTTLLLVSHDKQAIMSICDRAILLGDGQLIMEGKPESVLDFYNASLAKQQNQNLTQTIVQGGNLQTVSGTGEATVTAISILNSDYQFLKSVSVGQDVILQVDVDVKEDIQRLVFGYSIKDRLGQVIFGTNTDFSEQALFDVKANTRLQFQASFVVNLGPGSYSIQTALVSTDTHLVNNYDWRDIALIFDVVNTSSQRFAGTTWMNPSIKITKL
jgi:lipopolysaccharide transport system ATP-binding protein